MVTRTTKTVFAGITVVAVAGLDAGFAYAAVYRGPARRLMRATSAAR